MSRTSRPRAAVAAGLTLGATAASMFLAPSAFAALAAPTAPATVVAGTEFEVSGTGCTTTDEANPAAVIIATDSTSDNPDEVVFGDYTNEDGTWSISVSFPADTPLGAHQLQAVCGTEYGEEAQEYPVTDLTVVAAGTVAPAPAPGTPAASPTATPAATTPAADFKPGAKPNTPGVSSTSTDKTTGNAAAPGQKVVKVLKGFKPFEKVTVVLHSAPVVLGEFTADANGVVTVEFTVPAGTPLGNHTLAYDGSMGTHFEEPLQLTADGKALAYTGASIAMPLMGGSVLLAAGAGAMVIGRRRRSAGAAQV
ncbi:hypothetical protein KUM42_04905 [Modestobacter sp. L9-4]|uniref:hypothetical protein n=1 Tax=Modestobacter sp. L9-4 TaxID=2851567 RepID=UPI001C75D765|nr:hypothetical protein [Modestobacter sp. L9-4]QXG76880.1 hypothetical protein KUM42_04905 [Modestobacter sp. L9-4]